MFHKLLMQARKTNTKLVPEAFVIGELIQGHGHASYARVGAQWASVNGTFESIEEVRWMVTRPEEVAILNALA